MRLKCLSSCGLSLGFGEVEVSFQIISWKANYLKGVDTHVSVATRNAWDGALEGTVSLVRTAEAVL